MSSLVDVVVVSYNSSDELRECVAPLAVREDISVIVVDNNSDDASLDTVQGLPLTAIQLDENRGFGSGCNVGWHSGSSPYVLFLNPDARFSADGIRQLVERLEESGAGVAAPRVVDMTGETLPSLRHFPAVVSIFGQALFAHHLFRKASWADDVIRDPEVYEREAVHEWASGACLLFRRELLEEVGGFDEGYFLYCEEVDLCYRMRRAGHPLLYVPDVVCAHKGGASAPRTTLLPVLVQSRVRYATKWFNGFRRTAYRVGLVLNALTHVVFARSAAARYSQVRCVYTAVVADGGKR